MKQKHNVRTVNKEEYLNMVLWQNKQSCCIVYDFPFRTYIAPVESNQALHIGPYHKNIG